MGDLASKRLPKRSKTMRSKIIVDLKEFPKETMVEKRQKIKSMRRRKEDELTMLLENITRGNKRKSTSLRIKIYSDKDRGASKHDYTTLEQFTFNKGSEDSRDRRAVSSKAHSRNLQPMNLKTAEGRGDAEVRLKEYAKLPPSSIEDRERLLAEKEAELEAREAILRELALTHEVQMFHKRQSSKNSMQPNKIAKTSQTKVSNTKPKVPSHQKKEKSNSPNPAYLQEWLEAKNKKPIPRIGGLIHNQEPSKASSKEISLKGDSVEPEVEPWNADAGEISKARDYLGRKYAGEPKQVKKIDPSYYDREEEEALIAYRKRLRGQLFPGVEEHIEEVKNKKDRSGQKESSRDKNVENEKIQLEANDVFLNQFSSVEHEDFKTLKNEEGEKTGKYDPASFDMNNTLKKTNSWANRTNYGMKKVVAYNLKYATAEEG